ncbi:tetratricopeptide repeat protein [Bdellovibrio sp. SKB1291214]|uniref:tetratricopeptide repeat protein n=1 Tax=Bdellovibrio sp. SKB1291214 TaxID=1732569 RepID=UPI000B51AB38|nr:tetratricopeptide repeat protein [Bdellovibrio sp. SKB1291214]UYL08820.1 tetratricopeptide repeat protein [Bdellovibrio sp. SKB1291214]
MSVEVSNTDKVWLIKSSTRILGPFSVDEVAILLKSRQVSIIDEIRLPSGRWSYIRENQRFMDIVRAIREEQDNSPENTMTQSIPHNTNFTKTEPTGDSYEQTITPTPTMPPQMKDVSAASERPVNRSSIPAAGVSYGTSNDARVQDKIRQQSNVLRWGVIGLAAIAVVAIYVTLGNRDAAHSGNYDELISRAIRYKSVGLYEKSLASYKAAASMKEPDLDTQIQMAPVMISEDRQTLQGRRILEKAIVQESRQRSELVDAYLGIAVSYMMDGDLKEAENTLQKAIGHEPFNIAARLNLAIVEMKKGNYKEAMHKFEHVLSKEPYNVMALYGRSMAAMEVAKHSSDLGFLKPLVSDLQTALTKTHLLRQELSLFMIYAYNLLGDVDAMNQAIVKFLSEPPATSTLYTHSLSVDWRFTQWDYLEKYCAEVYSKSVPSAELKAVRASCLMEVNRDTDADKLLREAVTEGPRDPYVLVAQAAYLKKTGRAPEALAVLKMPELMTLPVRDRMMGDICVTTHDVNCAQTAFTKLYERNNTSAPALYGLAWVVIKRKDRNAAYNYVRAGLQSEPTFIPLLEMRDQLEAD